MEKKNIVVLFGGQSSEHVVSCMSVQNVAANINEEKYNVILVGITEDGHWVKVDSLSQVKDDTWRESKAGGGAVSGRKGEMPDRHRERFF